MRHYIIILSLFAVALSSSAQKRHSLSERQEMPIEREKTEFEKEYLSGWKFAVGVGLELGGAAPMPLPREIREIKSFNPMLNPYIEGIAMRNIDGPWGIRTGLRLEQKGMITKAGVKNYHMEMTADDGGYMEGAWTGNVKTKLRNIYLTLPIMASYTFNDERWEVHAGPYFSLLFDGNFSGSAYDGYIRHHDPTGEKAFVDHATYDFDSDLRDLIWGLQFGGSYRWNDNWAVNADLNWGVNGIFPSDFQCVTFSLYPIYGKLGLSYNF